MTELHLQTTAELVMYLLGAHRVEHFFLNPGTDSAPLQEAIYSLEERHIPVPRVITSTFESVSFAAAHGYFQQTGRPQCVFVHVDVGTLNLGAMLHNALRDRAGVIVIAGKTPYGERSDQQGGRSQPIHWQQDVPDQAGIVRGYAKWSFELTRADTAARVIGRAVQIASSPPAGLCYITVSRDVLMDPPETGDLRVERYAVPSPPALSSASLEEIATMLGAAERPLLLTSRIGRTKAGFDAVTRLAEVLAIPVSDKAEGGPLSISSRHPMSIRGVGQAKQAFTEADLLLMVECDVPWVPRELSPADEATIIHVDSDPVKANMPLWAYPVDLSAQADGATAISQLAHELEARVNTDPALAERIDQRRSRIEVRRTRDKAPVRSNSGSITVVQLMAALSEVLSEDDIVVEEAVTNADSVREYLVRCLPGTVRGAASSGLGWALGASVGIKLAAPTRRVVALCGDGSFMFGVPTAALNLAGEARAPFLAIILNNAGYRASRLPVFDLFPEGISAKRKEAVGTRFASAPDFAALAEACGAYGARVVDQSSLDASLRAGLKALESGHAAVIDVILDQ